MFKFKKRIIILCIHFISFIVFYIYIQHGEFEYKVELIDDSYSELKGEVAGPSGTPYEGGTFLLKIDVPTNYPFSPPKVSIILY